MRATCPNYFNTFSTFLKKLFVLLPFLFCTLFPEVRNNPAFVYPFISIKKKYLRVPNCSVSYKYFRFASKLLMDLINFFFVLLFFENFCLPASYVYLSESTPPWQAVRDLLGLLGWVTGGFVVLCPISAGDEWHITEKKSSSKDGVCHDTYIKKKCQEDVSEQFRLNR
jgi:hypothetical protein